MNAIRLEPKNFKAHNNRGLAWLKNNNPEKAISDFDAAIGLEPHNAEAFSNRGARGAS